MAVRRVLCLSCKKRVGKVDENESLSEVWNYLTAKHRGISPGCPRLRVTLYDETRDAKVKR